MEEISDKEIDQNIEWAQRFRYPVAEVLRLLKEERARLKAEIARLDRALDIMQEDESGLSRDEAYEEAGMGKFIDLTGHKFGRLVVVKRHRFNSMSNKTLWECLCNCGRKCIIQGASLRRGLSKSCGCFRNEKINEALYKHGLIKTPEYKSWSHMKDRCYNPNNPRYLDYGGRDIEVCERWRYSFVAFLEDMGLKPSDSHSIDRIDNNKGYSPDNCRWATPLQQNRNRRASSRKNDQ